MTIAPTAILPFPDRPGDRLRRALRGLDAALAEQRLAVAEFRQELGSLAEASAGLGGSLGTYRLALEQAAAETALAEAAARHLEATAAAAG